MLKGDKVLLRPVKRADIPLFLKWYNDPEVTQYLAIYLPITEMGEEKWFEEIATVRANTAVLFVMEALTANGSQPIGSLSLSGINNKDREATFGVAIGEKDYWSRGYGTEAARLLLKYGFEQLNLYRIASLVVCFNERSLKMHRKLGFVEEGRRRKASFKKGQYWDMLEFGLLEEEWKSGEEKKYDRFQNP